MTSMGKNKIILFANLKGGVGKSTLCSMFATYLAQHKMQVGLIDADVQQTIIKMRERDKLQFPDLQVPWNCSSLIDQDVTKIKEKMGKLKSLPFWVVTDMPGNLTDSNLLPIIKGADVIIVPMSYEERVLDGTVLFVKIVRKLTKAPLIFVPNMISDQEGIKSERELRDEAISILGKLGYITPRIKRSVVIKRTNTIKILDQYQTKAVEFAFESIIKYIENY